MADVPKQSGNEREPGTWGIGGTDGQRTWACFTCPKCEERYAVGYRRHAIAEDGTVSPSFVCVTPGCTFHEYIRLVGWNLGSLQPRPDAP